MWIHAFLLSRANSPWFVFAIVTFSEFCSCVYASQNQDTSQVSMSLILNTVNTNIKCTK